MQGINIFSPSKNSRDTVATMAAAAKWTQVAVVITSGAGVYIWAKDLALKYLPAYLPGVEFFGVLVGIAAGIGVGYLTDIGFGRILQDVLFRSLAKGHPNLQKYNNGSDYFGRFQKMELYLKWGLLAVLLTIDVATMVIITDPVSSAAGSDATVDIEGLRSELQAKHDANMADLRGMAKEKAKAVADTRYKVAASNPALAKLRANGNGWAASEIDKKARKATAADEKTRASTEAAISAAMSEGPRYIAGRIAEAERKNQETSERNAKAQMIAATMYLIFSVGLKFVTVYLRVLIVVSFCAYSYRYSPDLTGDGIIDYNDVNAYANQQRPAENENFRTARM